MCETSRYTPESRDGFVLTMDHGSIFFLVSPPLFGIFKLGFLKVSGFKQALGG